MRKRVEEGTCLKYGRNGLVSGKLSGKEKIAYMTIVLPARVNETDAFNRGFTKMLDNAFGNLYESRMGSLPPLLVVEMDFPKNSELATLVVQCALDIAIEHPATVVRVDFIDATLLFDEEPIMRDAFVENPKKSIFGHTVTDECTEGLEGLDEFDIKSSTRRCDFQIGDRIAVCPVTTFEFTPIETVADDQTEMDMVQLQPVARVQLQPFATEMARVQPQPVVVVQPQPVVTVQAETEMARVQPQPVVVVQRPVVIRVRRRRVVKMPRRDRVRVEPTEMCTVGTQTTVRERTVGGCFGWMFRFKRGDGQVADETQLP
jgi:hypothetical protein